RRPRPDAQLRDRRSESRNRRAQPDRRLGGGVGALGVWEEDPVKGSKRLSRRARLVWDLHPNQNIWTTCANFDGAGLGGQGCKQAIKLELFGAGRGSLFSGDPIFPVLWGNFPLSIACASGEERILT